MSRSQSHSRLRTLRPIRSQDLVSRVTDDLRRWIFEGKLEPDSELPSQAELADRFNVSRTVVREAMRNLSGQGLIDVGRGRKPRIKPVDPQAAIETLNAMLRRADGSLEHLLEVRRTIEGEVAALAAERASTAQVEQLVQANEDLRNARKLDRRIACDWRFHECLAEATNNPLFVLLIKTLGGLFDELLRRTSHSDTQVVYEAHSRLIDAVRRHHAGDARRIALANLELTRHDLHD